MIKNGHKLLFWWVTSVSGFGRGGRTKTLEGCISVVLELDEAIIILFVRGGLGGGGKRARTVQNVFL